MITELRTLIAVARHGTFAAAGDRVGLTQAAVSGHIRRLEEALGVALFDRTGRSATLNAAGLRTLERAEDLVGRFDVIGNVTRSEDWTGSLAIGAIASAQSTILPQALAAFRASFPLCRVHLSPGVSLDLMERVDAHQLDLALIIRPPFDLPADLLWRSLDREDYVLLAPSAVQGDDWRALVAEQPFIRYDRLSYGGRQVERLLRRTSLKPSEWLEVDDLQAIVAVVARGLGVAIAPLTRTVTPLPPGVRVVSLGSDLIQREVGVLVRTPGSEILHAFVECLVDAVAAEVDQGLDQTRR